MTRLDAPEPGIDVSESSTFVSLASIFGANLVEATRVRGRGRDGERGVGELRDALERHEFGLAGERGEVGGSAIPSDLAGVQDASRLAAKRRDVLYGARWRARVVEKKSGVVCHRSFSAENAWFEAARTPGFHSSSPPRGL
jgi:hypothetical protein